MPFLPGRRECPFLPEICLSIQHTLTFAVLYLYCTCMNTVHEAKRILREAEGALKELIANALRNQQYDDVATIAAMAEKLARLVNADVRAEQTPDAAISRTTPQVHNRQPATKAVTNRSRQNTDKSPAKKNQSTYPRFIRESDRLIKVGWSKKNKTSYEHRAPKESVMAFLNHLMATVSEGELFSVEELLPANDPSTGMNIPAYQAYMTIAWLRGTDVLDKKGRDGYILNRHIGKNSQLDDLWKRLPTR